jgi:hypothetical protein
VWMWMGKLMGKLFCFVVQNISGGTDIQIVFFQGGNGKIGLLIHPRFDKSAGEEIYVRCRLDQSNNYLINTIHIFCAPDLRPQYSEE